MSVLVTRLPFFPILIAAVVAAGGAPARAQAPPRDPQWRALADGRKFAELEQAAAARLAAHPDDAEAWNAYVQGVLGQNGPAASGRRDAALVKLDACVKTSPQIAACHYGVGAVTGVQVMSQGMMKAAFGIGQVRDEFVKALAIDPAFYAARSGLVQFYLMVPGLAGGSVSKARDVAQAAASKQPEHAKLLDAMILQYDDKAADAERLLATVQVGSDADLANELRGQWISLGFGYLEAKQPAKARAIFERAARDKADQPEAHYGLGRALSDQRQWDDAIAELKLAATLPGHDTLPVDYRLGIALQSKGEAAQAKAAFQRYVGSAGATPHNADDAKKRLADLG